LSPPNYYGYDSTSCLQPTKSHYWSKNRMWGKMKIQSRPTEDKTIISKPNICRFKSNHWNDYFLYANNFCYKKLILDWCFISGIRIDRYSYTLKISATKIDSWLVFCQWYKNWFATTNMGSEQNQFVKIKKKRSSFRKNCRLRSF